MVSTTARKSRCCLDLYLVLPDSKRKTTVYQLCFYAHYFFFFCLNRKYKPLHMQSMTFPSLQYLGRFSPFESPPPPQFDKWAECRGNKTRFVGIHYLSTQTYSVKTCWNLVLLLPGLFFAFKGKQRRVLAARGRSLRCRSASALHPGGLPRRLCLIVNVVVRRSPIWKRWTKTFFFVNFGIYVLRLLVKCLLKIGFNSCLLAALAVKLAPRLCAGSHQLLCCGPACGRDAPRLRPGST